MPKFLDTPTWISKSGQTVEALGLIPGQQTAGKGQVLASSGNGIAPGWGPKITAWQGSSTTIGNFITQNEAGVLFVWGNTGRAGLINREDPFDFCIIVKTKSENNAYYITINGSTVQRMSVATTSATISTQSASSITVLSILAEDVTQQ